MFRFVKRPKETEFRLSSTAFSVIPATTVFILTDTAAMAIRERFVTKIAPILNGTILFSGQINAIRGGVFRHYRSLTKPSRAIWTLFAAKTASCVTGLKRELQVGALTLPTSCPMSLSTLFETP